MNNIFDDLKESYYEMLIVEDIQINIVYRYYDAGDIAVLLRRIDNHLSNLNILYEFNVKE